MGLSKQEIARYNRHLILPELGLEGQLKLKEAKVLVIGAGGLGAPLLQYLSAAGVGTIGIVDFDKVEDSNLQRQVLFTQNDIGKFKVDAAKERVETQNSHIQIHTYKTAFTSENAMEIAKEYNVIADGTDNFPTRYLVNDVSVLLNIPNVYASILKFEGQVSVFNYTDSKGEVGPNYRDLFPVPPNPETVQSCAEGGVLGVLPGIIGSMQANEVIKVITGVGENLSGRLFLFDALKFESRTLKIEKNPSNPEIKELIDYKAFCGHHSIQKVQQLNSKTLKEWISEGKDYQLIDVREASEFEEKNLGGLLIPKGEIHDRINEISKEKDVVLHCGSGKRSAVVIQSLQEEYGFKNLYNLEGGIVAYQSIS